MSRLMKKEVPVGIWDFTVICTYVTPIKFENVINWDFLNKFEHLTENLLYVTDSGLTSEQEELWKELFSGLIQ